MAFDANLTNLNYVLAGLYPQKSASERIVEIAGLPITHIKFQDSAIDNWYAILKQAKERGKVLDVIQAALKDWPEDPDLLSAEKVEWPSVRGPVIGKDLRRDRELPGAAIEKRMEEQGAA